MSANSGGAMEISIMWNPFLLVLLPAALVGGDASIFRPDPSIQDPRRIWHIETETPRNNLKSAMRDRGLAPDGGEETRAARYARALVVRRLLERVNGVYGRRPDGSAVPRRSLDVTFCATVPDLPRYRAGPGQAYSRICVGGAQRSCGGTLGVQYLDFGNRFVEEECSAGRIGVFAGRVCGLRSWLTPPLEASEARFVDGTYRLGDGTSAEDARFIDVRTALEDWGTALGNVTAHEIGHGMGLEHDRGSGYVMEARISSEDLSSDSLAMSPASVRQLANDVGIAALLEGDRSYGPAGARGTERHVLESDRETTLGTLSGKATAIGVRDGDGRMITIVRGAADDLRGEIFGVPKTGAGIIFAFADGDGGFVEADVPAVRDAIAARVRGHLAMLAPDRRGGRIDFLAQGLSSAVPRIAGDAVLDLGVALEGDAGLVDPKLAYPALAARVAEALARNSRALGDLRAPIRLAGRLGAKDAVEEIIALVATEEEIDLAPAAAEALDALGARTALAHRVAAHPPGRARQRLLRTLARMPSRSIADLESLLAHEDPGISLEAAKTLLRAGPVERARLFGRARQLPPARRAAIEALRQRPLP